MMEATYAKKAHALLAGMLHGKGCKGFDVVLAHEGGCFGDGRIAHDDRGAPYVVDSRGREQTDVLISFSDEKDMRVCAWARTWACADVVGLGVDLVDACEFDDGERAAFLTRALLSEGETSWARTRYPDKPSLGYAYAFGAKEAAFKATSHPLRMWCCARDAELHYEVRDFALAEDGAHERCACRSLDVFGTLGISIVELGHVVLGNTVLVIACAMR